MTQEALDSLNEQISIIEEDISTQYRRIEVFQRTINESHADIVSLNSSKEALILGVELMEQVLENKTSNED